MPIWGWALIATAAVMAIGIVALELLWPLLFEYFLFPRGPKPKK